MAQMIMLKQNCNFNGSIIIYHYKYRNYSIEKIITDKLYILLSSNSNNTDNFELNDSTSASEEYIVTTIDNNYNIKLNGKTKERFLVSTTSGSPKRQASDAYNDNIGFYFHQYKNNIQDGLTSSKNLGTTGNISYFMINYDNSVSANLNDDTIKSHIADGTINEYLDSNGNNYKPTIILPTAIKIDTPSNTTIKKGGTLTLTATITPLDATDKTITYTSSNSNVSINGNVITGVSVGNVTVTATTSNGLTDTIELAVSDEQDDTFIKNMSVQNYSRADLIVTNAYADEFTESDILYKNETGNISLDFNILKNAFDKTQSLNFIVTPKTVDSPLTNTPYLTIKYNENGTSKSVNISGNIVDTHPINSTTTVNGYKVGIYFFSYDTLTVAFGGANAQYDTEIAVKDISEMIFNCNAGQITPPKPDTPSEYGLFNIYKTSIDELNSLSSDHFKVTSTEYYYTSVDLYQYITSLIEYPFAITASNNLAIILGGNVTQINSHTVDSNLATVSIEIPINGFYNDNRDIKNSVITLFLPYIDSFTIDSQYINSKIKAVYNIDLLTNACICYIFADDTLIESKSVLIGYKLPYIQEENKINELTENNRFIKNQCFISVKQYLNSTQRFITLKNDFIKNFSGFVKSNEHIIIDSSIPKDELDNIKQLLQNGIIV